MTSARRNHSRAAASLLLCTLLAIAQPAVASKAREKRDRAAAALQTRRLDQGKTALVRLRADARRRRYRDGWESIARDLDSAVRGFPEGPRAAEAALWAARARDELWNVSRSDRDRSEAIAVYASVDERYSGTEPAALALAAAIRLAAHSKDGRQAAQLGHRLSRYPRTSDAAAALALIHEPARSQAAQPGRSDTEEGTRAAIKSDRKGQRPVELDDADEAAGPSAKTEAVTPIEPSARAPDREPDTDVPAEASRIVDDLLEASRGTARAALANGAAVLKAAHDEPVADAQPKPVAGAQAEPVPGAQANPVPQVLAEEEGSEISEREVPPEPEATEAPTRPAQTSTVRASPLSADEVESQAEAAQKARQLRSAMLADRSASVAAQLGLKVRTVVIDPGHGGKDTGAVGPHGVREKDVALAIAKKLAARLRLQGLAVVLTRDSDVFVPLDDRTRIANQAHADLFVSVHCNAARRRKLSGVETWTLNVASDHYAARLASFENATDQHTVSDLRLILADLATKANAGDARELAQAVQASLVRTLRSRVGNVRDNGVKQALFYVLLGTHMPSILVETAFLSNPTEEKRLVSAKYQEGAADAIARGLRDFLDGRRKLALAP